MALVSLMKESFFSIARQIRYVIAPPFCAYCKKYLSIEQILCDRCNLLVKPVVSQTLQITATKKMQVFAISLYQEPLKSLILAKRWSNVIASKQLAQLMWERTVVSHLSIDYCVPIPLHWTRYAARGYNQAEVMAEYIAQQSGAAKKNLLRRTQRTVFQASLSGVQRTANVKDVFALVHKFDPIDFEGKHILLVDDLMTTGATLVAVAKEIYRLQPASVSAVVACRTH